MHQLAERGVTVSRVLKEFQLQVVTQEAGHGTRPMPRVLAAGVQVASRFVWKFGAALPVPLADALSRRTTIVDLCHSG